MYWRHRNWCTRDGAVALLACVCRFEYSTRDAAVTLLAITISLLVMSSLVSRSDRPNDEQNAAFFRKSEIICPVPRHCHSCRTQLFTRPELFIRFGPGRQWCVTLSSLHKLRVHTHSNSYPLAMNVMQACIIGSIKDSQIKTS